MELIYAWIQKYRNYKNVELKFSGKFEVNYDDRNKKINIKLNKDYCEIYPKHITNINAIVGINGIGKTNLLDLIGMRISDRNRNNEEYEIIFKDGKKVRGMYKPKDTMEIKNSIYFLLYYFGKDNDGEDIFCIEGNDIDSFLPILESKIELEINYRRGKYWFPYVCTYLGEKLHVKYDLNNPIKYREMSGNGKERFICEKVKKDPLVIISFRENLNIKNYDNQSIKASDESKICVPRRISTFNSRFLENKLRMLFNQINNDGRMMFRDDNYVLNITYDDFWMNEAEIEKHDILCSYKNLEDDHQRKICRILAAYIYRYYSILYKDEKDKLKQIENNLIKFDINIFDFQNYIFYYKKIVEYISSNYFQEKEESTYAIKCFNIFCDNLIKCKSINIEDNVIEVTINKESNMDEIIKFIRSTIDQGPRSNFEEKFAMFGDFFTYTIDNMSDGEKAFLGIYASLYEQIAMLANNKEEYIILLDEPEARMHPELARNFILDLINFLKDLSENKKKFQIIISTHSPFILSDIQTDDIIFLEKNKNGDTIPCKKKIKTFGDNIYNLLKSGFFMNSTSGEFAKEKINKLISALKPIDKNKDTNEFSYNSIEKILELVQMDSIEDVRKFIEIIGEPIIEMKLNNMLDEILSKDKKLNSKIIKEKIRSLELELRRLGEENKDDTNKN